MHSLALPVALVSLAAAGLATAGRPHLLFIVADDYGWNDVGYHQNAVSGANPKGLPTTNKAAGIMRTPTLDALSKEGARLEMYYVQPLCSPTRATFMTGRYASHTGIGPDVIVGNSPYGLPKREVLLPQLLRDGGYATHMVGKWHLGYCHQGYMPSARGFDTFMGYLDGGKDYYNHAGERNGTGGLPSCMGRPTHEYSSKLYADEASRIVRAHDAKKPLFLYLAMQSVHNPYDIPPKSMVDVDKVYSDIKSENRRIYAGMVQLLDTAVSEVVDAYKAAGLWEDTVLIFTTDNGGTGPGNNYPLRGMKVHDWEGGIRGVAFVRGTDSSLAPVPKGTVVDELMHSTDWLPTLCGLAGASTSGTLPLDGVDQWGTIAHGQPSGRDVIMHNVPVKNHAVKSKKGWSTSNCFAPDKQCNCFGDTGGAVRKGDYKLLWTGDGHSSNSPAGTRQNPPGGRGGGFEPSTHDVIPEPYKLGSEDGLYLFNIRSDPTESHNLASQNKAKLQELMSLRDSYAAEATTVACLGWRWGSWKMDTVDTPRDGCAGPGDEPKWCAYGHEFDCQVPGNRKHVPCPGQDSESEVIV